MKAAWRDRAWNVRWPHTCSPYLHKETWDLLEFIEIKYSIIKRQVLDSSPCCHPPSCSKIGKISTGIYLRVSQRIFTQICTHQSSVEWYTLPLSYFMSWANVQSFCSSYYMWQIILEPQVAGRTRCLIGFVFYRNKTSDTSQSEAWMILMFFFLEKTPQSHDTQKPTNAAYSTRLYNPCIS